MNGEKMNVINDDVEKLIDSIHGDMIVCERYQLFKLGESFTLESKKLLDDRKLITKDWFFDRNNQVQMSGILYVYNHEKTLKYYEDSKVQMAARKKAQELKDATASSFVNALDSIQKTAIKTIDTTVKSEKKETSIPDGIPTTDWDKQEIQSWLELKGISFKKTLGAGSLIETVVNPYLETLKTGE